MLKRLKIIAHNPAKIHVLSAAWATLYSISLTKRRMQGNDNVANNNN